MDSFTSRDTDARLNTSSTVIIKDQEPEVGLYSTVCQSKGSQKLICPTSTPRGDPFILSWRVWERFYQLSRLLFLLISYAYISFFFFFRVLGREPICQSAG